MTHYIVRWSIDIFADSPKEAAEQALAIQRDPESVATIFEVTNLVNKESNMIDNHPFEESND